MNPDHKLIKAKYGLLYNTVTALLFEADHLGINFGNNTDEYDPETSSILTRLTSAKTVDDNQTIVHEEFCRWFSPEDAGSREDYRHVSAKIWEAWTLAFPKAPV
ncbi:MAG: hypothetical protein ACLPV8_06525 [Steroidobacteraceae bacterium]